MAGGGTGLRTLAGPGAGRVEVRRSKFMSYARPVPEGADVLREWLAEVRGRHPDARHVVYAWRGLGDQWRGSDDGEPHGSGARPCQDALGRADVRLAAVAVARVFGGTLLGAGNLGRAYAEAARMAVVDAGTRALVPRVEIHVRAGFADAGVVRRRLRSQAGPIAQQAADQGLIVTAWVDPADGERLRRDLEARTSSRVHVTLGAEVRWVGVPGSTPDPGEA